MPLIRVGFENKRHVYVLAALCALILSLAVWELAGASQPDARPSSSQSRSSLSAGRRIGIGPDDLSNAGLEPHLRIRQLDRSEQVEYSSSGRNIFSFVEKSAPIEPPAAPPRPSVTTALPLQAPVVHKLPLIDLKYLGYLQDRNEKVSAILMRGDDTLVAKTGEIVFHRYEVGEIRAGVVKITDLSDANTQSIGRSEK